MSEKQLTKEELLAKAEKPAKDALKLHPFYQGKIQVVPKCSIWDFSAFGVWYTPGVAASCRAIEADPAESFRQTNRANTIAVVSDGTRVLGLGDIGPAAGQPVMEGKALLFKYLGGVDAVPLSIGMTDSRPSAEEIINFVKLIQPSFGGINLEDISKPKCYKVLETLRNDPEITIPVWHDDAQGTASVVTAGVIGAVKHVGKELDQIKVAMLGVGAANTRTAYVLESAGVPLKNITMADSKGIISKDRPDIIEQKDYDTFKYDLAQKTNPEGKTGDFGVATEGADVMISASKSEPGTVKQEWISSMASDSIVFACANPLPEIYPWDAKEAGARVIGTGRSDFDNQINNSLGFPGIFRGTLDVNASTITDEMCVAAAQAIANIAIKKGLRDDYVIPTMDDWEIFPYVASKVGMKAIEQGVARKVYEEDELYKMAQERIKYARDLTKSMMDTGFIKPKI
ncbi:MAG: NADP-dependent malic enzyme [Candidatus Heimdallarchaeota archaeon]|nr:NADP-dependent malic enzyme [Candidatus Heimdallarchaeota archaeon]MCG3256019.1 NADP-dependent malic enzyme [Candidatus Heimdallarchaeota archaeon]MCK4611089.1 NADP-dependent malic enzyme [Candidatus Heimdallarchaeota archaeon]